MRVVAVDTSRRTVYRDAVVHVPASDGHDSWHTIHDAHHLEELVPRRLAELDAAAAGALVAVIGPGSLTGIRIGVAALLGVAATSGAPIHAVGSLEVTALGAGPARGEVVAVADAGRGGLWVARYRLAGTGMVEVSAPVRVEAAGWRAPEGIPVARLDEATPPGGERAVIGLLRGVRMALTRPPLDPTRVDPAAAGAAGPGL